MKSALNKYPGMKEITELEFMELIQQEMAANSHPAPHLAEEAPDPADNNFGDEAFIDVSRWM